MEGYNLIYRHKETGKEFFAKRVTKHDYILLDPETGVKLPLSAWAISQHFNADSRNNDLRKKVWLSLRNYKRRAKQ